MIDTLKALADTAKKEFNANCYIGAKAVINGKTVVAQIIGQCRRTKNQKTSVMWKVEGKRVAAKDLMAALEN
jgi:hypothetical protein